MSFTFRLPSAVPPKRPSVCVSRSLQSGNRRLVSPFDADFRRRAPGRACRRVGHPSFFQRGFIQRGRPGVSGRGQEAPREPVPDDAGTGRPAASPCRLSSTGIPTAACRRGRAARPMAASPPRRTRDGSSSGPAHGSDRAWIGRHKRMKAATIKDPPPVEEHPARCRQVPTEWPSLLCIPDRFAPPAPSRPPRYPGCASPSRLP